MACLSQLWGEIHGKINLITGRYFCLMVDSQKDKKTD